MPAELVVLPDPIALARAAAVRVVRELDRAIDERDWGFLALPGGSLARQIFQELVELQLPWDRVDFFFVDERIVPTTHPANNFGGAQDVFLINQRIGPHQFHRVETDDHDLDHAAQRYEEELPDDGFDVVLAEIGHDGHVGSLYPASPAFDEHERLAMPIEAAHKPKLRVTLTPRAWTRARTSIVFAAGRDKAAIVREALEGELDPRRVPAQLLRDGVWMLDRAAAELLARR